MLTTSSTITTTLVVLVCNAAQSLESLSLDVSLALTKFVLLHHAGREGKAAV